MCLEPAAVRLGFSRPGAAKVSPELFDRFYMDLKQISNVGLCEFRRLTGRDNAASQIQRQGRRHASSLLLFQV